MEPTYVKLWQPTTMCASTLSLSFLPVALEMPVHMSPKLFALAIWEAHTTLLTPLGNVGNWKGKLCQVKVVHSDVESEDHILVRVEA